MSVPRALRWAAAHAGLLLSCGVVLIVAAWAVAPSLFTGVDPIAVVPTDRFQPPSAEHWLGTDQLGRDQFARIVHGARASLSAAAIAVGVAAIVGSLVGALAGWFGGVVDSAAMRLIDVALSIRGFLLAITIVMLLGFGIVQAAVAVGLTTSAAFARVIRSEVLTARASGYVEAAVSSGASTFDVLRRHVIPNSAGPTLSLMTVQFGIAIIWIASLSFLGLGAQPPESEWGRLVADNRDFIATRGWLALFPGLTIAATVLAVNHIAHRLHRGEAS